MQGGKICLNIKWHNQFRLYNCYINGAQEYGIYTEGWSHRFLNSIIRWCLDSGIYGAIHFNDIVIRDCYFSRNGVGITAAGGNGINISGCGMELNGNSAIVARNLMSLKIRDCYFEGNGYELPEYFEIGVGFPSGVHLDYGCKSVLIQGNIFRGSTASALLSLSYSIDARITNNAFENNAIIPGSIGILLRNECETNLSFGPYVARTIVKDNHFVKVDHWLAEEESGLIDTAIGRDSLFQKWAGANIVSSEQLGSELVIDGDMELASVANWSNQYSPETKEKSIAEAKSGVQSLHIVSDSAGDGVCQIFTPLKPLELGKVYKVSLWVKNMDPAEYLNFKISAGDRTIFLKTYDTEWKSFVFYLTFDSYAGNQYFSIAYGTTTSDVYIDDISIKEVISSDLF